MIAVSFDFECPAQKNFIEKTEASKIAPI